MHEHSIIPEIILSILVSTISLVVAIFASLFGVKELSSPLFNFIVALILLAILAFLFRKKIIGSIIDSFIKLVLNYSAKHPNIGFGFDKIYKNLKDAKLDIVQDFIKSNTVKLFFHLGKGVIGEKYSLLYEHACAKKDSKQFALKILYSSKDSPFLSSDKAVARESKHLEWMKSLDDVEQSIRIFKSIELDVESKKHNEAFFMKLFIFNDSLYVIPFLYEKKNDENAPVFRFIRTMPSSAKEKSSDNPNSVFYLFVKYFDFIWDFRSQ